MKILYINYTDIYGSRFNGFDTLDTWEKHGHEARMLVWHKGSMDARVETLWSNTGERNSINRLMMLDSALSLQACMVSGAKYIMRHRFFQWADVVHFQVLHNVMFFSMRHLFQLSQCKPTVWTLHDLWALTGHCVHPEGCDQWRTGCAHCPAPERPMPLTRSTANLLWRYKKYYYAKARMDIIVSSQWMKRYAVASPLLHNKTVHCVPFALREDCKLYTAPKISLRNVLGIDDNSYIITFRASRASFKRLDFIRKALLQWQPSIPVHLVTLDQCGGLDDLCDRYPVTELGWINNESLLSAVYHMSNVFLTPTHESFCMMALEALACGVPVICLENSAVAEMCKPPLAGLAVPDGNVSALASALNHLSTISVYDKGLKIRCKQQAEKYSFSQHISMLMLIYKSHN